MNKQTKRMNAIFYALLAQAVFVAAPAQAQTDTATASLKREATASDHVRNAVGVVRKIEGVPRLRGVLHSAKGIFIVPSYARAAVGVGAAGGTGILLVRQADGGWSDPVFYNTGGLSVGLQAGAQGGSLVLVLNNDKAVSEFLKKNNFSVNAKAGLTVVNWNKMVQGSAGTGDIVAWSDTHGLFGDVVTAEVNDIRFNQKLTNAYYRRTLAATDVIKGHSTNVQSAPLVQALVDVAAPAQ
jgi:lipid-binding SYLF domain-containing protein